MSNICIHCFITGRVQGVFYRDSTKKKARSLGIKGWAKNLPDGRVEVFACGDEAALNKLKIWLWKGPPAAKVVNVISTQHPWEPFDDFLVNPKSTE